MTLPEKKLSLVGRKWVYSFNRWKAKKLIPVKCILATDREVKTEIPGKHKERHGDHNAFRAQGRHRFKVRQRHEGDEGSGDLAARGHDVSRGLWRGRRFQGVRSVGIRAARAKVRRAPEADPAETQNRVVARAPAAAREEHLQRQVALRGVSRLLSASRSRGCRPRLRPANLRDQPDFL